MYPGVSDILRESIPAGFESHPKVTVEVDGVVTELEYMSGSVSNSSSSNVRRTVRDLTVQHAEMTPRQVYDLISAEASVVRAWAGIRWRQDLIEQVPVFTGRPSLATLRENDGTVTMDCADFGYDIGAQTLLPAVVQPASMRRVDAIKALLVGANIPASSIQVTATDTGTLGSEQSWSGSRWDAINALATDGLMDVLPLPDGNFLIRDLPVLGTPVYTFYTHGDDATVAVADRQRPLDKLYNTVAFNATASDTSQSWVQEIRQVSATSPRAVSKIGARVLSRDSTTITTSAAAQTAAAALLDQVQGTTEQVAITALGHPGLECGDTVEVVIGNPEDTDAEHLILIIDDISSFDIGGWDQSLNVRNRTEEDS